MFKSRKIFILWNNWCHRAPHVTRGIATAGDIREIPSQILLRYCDIDTRWLSQLAIRVRVMSRVLCGSEDIMFEVRGPGRPDLCQWVILWLVTITESRRPGAGARDFPNHNIDTRLRGMYRDCGGDSNFYFRRPMLTPFPWLMVGSTFIVYLGFILYFPTKHVNGPYHTFTHKHVSECILVLYLLLELHEREMQ